MPTKTNSRYVVAVSGGVDSVVLLDALANQREIGGRDPWAEKLHGEVIVAHFDHGIREDSADDERFVRALAGQYTLPYYSAREELGKNASEETARNRRYAFLKRICDAQHATLVTAHHANDVAETVAINLTRGTGWRGLAVMDTARIWRPLLNVTKSEIHDYAKEHRITWREDSTNASDAYLRNRLRARFDDQDIVWQTLALRARQVELKHQIDTEANKLTGSAPYSRYFFTHCGDAVALELLRHIFIKETESSPPPPIRRRALHAIKVARAGATAHVSSGVSLSFTRTGFIVYTGDKVIS